MHILSSYNHVNIHTLNTGFDCFIGYGVGHKGCWCWDPFHAVYGFPIRRVSRVNHVSFSIFLLDILTSIHFFHLSVYQVTPQCSQMSFLIYLLSRLNQSLPRPSVYPMHLSFTRFIWRYCSWSSLSFVHSTRATCPSASSLLFC